MNIIEYPLMKRDEKIEQIIKKILESKNYKNIYPPTVERIVNDTFSRYPLSKVENESKRRLHQISGVYTQAKTNSFDKLQNHSSTKEREKFLDEFYKYIFSEIGDVETIIDVACGMNPLTYPYMKTNADYVGFDIDENVIRLVDSEIRKTNFSNKIKVFSGDIYEIDEITSDVCFLFKIVPLLEQQKKGSTEEIIKKIKSKYIVITFPTKSLSNIEKGMDLFYTEFMYKIIQKLNCQYDKRSFENESVFIVKKPN